MESMRDTKCIMEREVKKGSTPLSFERIEIDTGSYQEITSEEKLTEVLQYLHRVGNYKSLAGKTVINNVYTIMRRTYTLNLPQLEKLESISLNQNEKDISINGREEMKDILYVLNGTKRVTKNESIQDAPVNIDDEIKVDFHFIEAGVSTIFVYNKNNSYYIEQPYNGIYQISGDEYNSIEKLVR